MIVAFNSLEHIGRCIAAIPHAAPGVTVEVLLIDNGDGSTERFVRESFPEVAIVPSRGNIGFGAGNNELARHANAPLLLLLNPDMVLSPDAIVHLFELSREKPDASAWGGVTLDENGAADASNHLRFPSLGTLALRLLFLGDRSADPGSAIGSGVREMDVVMGGFVMIPRAFWQALGGLDEGFFLYCEETDFFLRARQAGKRAWRTPHATATHFAGSGNSHSPARILYQAAGLAHFLHKHWSWPKAAAGILLWWLIACERYLLGRLAGRFWGSARRIGTAYSTVALYPAQWVNGYTGSYWARRLGRRVAG